MPKMTQVPQKKNTGGYNFSRLMASIASPQIDRLVEEIVSRVADKWTLLLLEVLAQHGVVRFSRLAQLVHGISQKMLTQTLRQMESDGFVTRTIDPVVPPRVEYALTTLGESLGAAFCSVWNWAELHHEELQQARTAYRERVDGDSMRDAGILDGEHFIMRTSQDHQGQ